MGGTLVRDQTKLSESVPLATVFAAIFLSIGDWQSRNRFPRVDHKPLVQAQNILVELHHWPVRSPILLDEVMDFMEPVHLKTHHIRAASADQRNHGELVIRLEGPIPRLTVKLVDGPHIAI